MANGALHTLTSIACLHDTNSWTFVCFCPHRPTKEKRYTWQHSACHEAVLIYVCLWFPQSMCFQVRDALRVGCIGISNQFFCNTMDPKEVLKILDDELRNYCILVEAPKTPFGRSKKTYSGKVGGRQDDVVIVLQLAVTGAR